MIFDEWNQYRFWDWMCAKTPLLGMKCKGEYQEDRRRESQQVHPLSIILINENEPPPILLFILSARNHIFGNLPIRKVNVQTLALIESFYYKVERRSSESVDQFLELSHPPTTRHAPSHWARLVLIVDSKWTTPNVCGDKQSHWCGLALS